MTALPGLAPAHSARASAANHREVISACQRDDLGAANDNDYAFPQDSCAPRGRACVEQKSRRKQFRNWCRPDPDFLWMLVELPNCMRLSAKKVAHHCSRPVLRCRKSGKRQAFRGFLPRKTTPRELYRAMVIAKRFKQGCAQCVLLIEQF
jgi:hypothetical protein